MAEGLSIYQSISSIIILYEIHNYSNHPLTTSSVELNCLTVSSPFNQLITKLSPTLSRSRLRTSTDWGPRRSRVRDAQIFFSPKRTEGPAPTDAKKEFKKAAGFFSKFRAIAGGAYFSTPAGWKAIGYVGNTPMASFDGPPKEVLERLGLSQPLDA